MFDYGDPYEHLPNSGCFSENSSPGLGKGWEGHNLLSNHGLINGRFICPPEYSELKGEAGYIFHWQKK